MKLNSKVYDVVKAIAQIYLPALATLYVALATIYHLGGSEQFSLTVLAVDTFLGVILKISASAYNNSPTEAGGKFGGTLALQGSQLKLTSIDTDTLLNDSEITLKIVKEANPDPDLARRPPVDNRVDPNVSGTSPA